MLRAVLRLLVDELGGSLLGQPTRLRRLIAKTPSLQVCLAEPKPVVAASCVVQWHHWEEINSTRRSKKGLLQYWVPYPGGHSARSVHRPELEHIVQHTTTENWRCDIQDVVGLSASKSKIRDFATLDDMVATNAADMIFPVSDARLSENLKHREIRILPQHGGSDYFTRYMWAGGRVFLMNDGGSHHFAAARYIAARLGRPVLLSGTLHTYAIRADAAASLIRDYDLYAMPKREVYGFLDAMRSLRAPFGEYGLPEPYGDAADLILLPKGNPRSMRASTVLREAGISDFGQVLTSAVSRQPVT